MTISLIALLIALITGVLGFIILRREIEKEDITTSYDEFDDGEKYSMAEIEQACSKASEQAAGTGINLKLESEKRQQQFKAREFLDNKKDSKPYYKRNPKPWE